LSDRLVDSELVFLMEGYRYVQPPPRHRNGETFVQLPAF